MVNYNFFSSFTVCKLLVGVYSSPGLPLRKAGLMGKNTKIPLPCREQRGAKRRVSPEEEKKGRLRKTPMSL
jgi:hypothetical protein